MCILRIVALALLAAFTGMATAQAAALPTPLPDVKPDWSSMNFQLGTWTCTRTGTSDRPGTARIMVTNAMALDDHWMTTHNVSPPFDQARTRDAVFDGYTGYDSTSHLWVFFGASNFGGFNLQTSPGWTGNSITWTVYDTSSGQPAVVGREHLVKLSDNETRNSLQKVRKDGSLSPEVVVACKKT